MPERNEKVLFQILRAVRARQHQAVLPLDDRGVIDLGAVGVGEIDPGAARPATRPSRCGGTTSSREALVLDQAVEARLPVVAEVGAGDVQLARMARQNADLVAARRAGS